MSFVAVKLLVSVEGEVAASRIIHGAEDRARDLRPFFNAAKAEIIATETARFAEQGAVDGEPAWAALRGQYAKWKARRHPGQPILQRSGALLADVTNPTTQIEATQMTLTVATAYAVYHASRRERTSSLPRRPFFTLNKRQVGRLQRLLREWLLPQR